MLEVIICDTNAAIQLAIIFPDSLLKPNKKMKFVIHSTLKHEIKNLKKDSEKNTRLGDILNLLLTSVATSQEYQLPLPDHQIKLHQRIMAIEDSLEPSQISAGSSKRDRLFLILAKIHKAKLLTNERTLRCLAAALLGVENTLSVSDIIERIYLSDKMLKPALQAGLNTLSEHGEFLRFDCANKVRALGFEY